MRLNFITRYFQTGTPGGAGGDSGRSGGIAGALGSLGGSAAGINPVGASIAGLQAALGLVQTISGNAKVKKLLGQRRAYTTPAEVQKILDYTLSLQGGDTITRDFLTGQINRSFSQSANTALQLGADLNDLSRLFEQKVNSLMQVGNQFHASNMEAFGKALAAYDLMASNKTAEWQSQQDIIKDKLQASGLDKQAGIQNLGSAANAYISLDASRRTSNLYRA